MGKKTKFIEKADSQKFHLLHRSQRDEAHQGYEVPSNFVLVPAVDVSSHSFSYPFTHKCQVTLFPFFSRLLATDM
jgi:hypothetical protein